MEFIKCFERFGSSRAVYLKVSEISYVTEVTNRELEDMELKAPWTRIVVGVGRNDFFIPMPVEKVLEMLSGKVASEKENGSVNLIDLIKCVATDDSAYSGIDKVYCSGWYDGYPEEVDEISFVGKTADAVRFYKNLGIRNVHNVMIDAIVDDMPATPDPYGDYCYVQICFDVAREELNGR